MTEPRSADSPPPFRSTPPAQAKELLDGPEGWAYLDVRTVEEFEAGHVPGAYNVPAFVRSPTGMAPNPHFLDVVARRFSREQPLVVGCAAGGRSAHACEALAAQGFTSLVNMHGGFSGAPGPTGEIVEPGWAACGFPVERGARDGRGYDALSG